MRILSDPIDDGLLLVGADTLVGVAHALEDVVDVLGDSEDAGPWLGDWRWC